MAKAEKRVRPVDAAMAKDPLKEPVSVERLAELFQLSSRHVRRVLDEKRVPRVRHGEVEFGVGAGAVIRHLEAIKARRWVSAWTDDPALQRFLAAAMVAYWRGHEDAILKLGATD